MIAKFFLYEKATGIVIYFNAEPPVNDDYLEAGRTLHADFRSGVEGANFDLIGAWENDIGIEVDEAYVYVYNPTTNELTQGEPI